MRPVRLDSGPTGTLVQRFNPDKLLGDTKGTSHAQGLGLPRSEDVTNPCGGSARPGRVSQLVPRAGTCPADRPRRLQKAKGQVGGDSASQGWWGI